MKVELIKAMGKNAVGHSFVPRSEEQGKMLVDEGWAKEVQYDTPAPKKLVLLNPEPGVHTTAWVDADWKEGDVVEEPSLAMTTTTVLQKNAADVIAEIQAATTVEQVYALSTGDARKTVAVAAAKKIEELKG